MVARMYRKVAPNGGDGIMHDIAKMPGVQAKLEAVQETIFIGASAQLARAKHRTGASDIVTSEGTIDKFVALEDYAGGAAAAIEFGPLAPLRTGVSLAKHRGV